MAPVQYRRGRGVTRSKSQPSASIANQYASTILRILFCAALLCSVFGIDEAVFAQTVNDPRWRNFKQDDGLTSNDIWSILVDDNVVWFGEGDGLNRFDGTWSSYSSDSPFASDGVTADNPQADTAYNPAPFALDIQGDVTALERDTHAPNSGQIWIGTRTGQLSVLSYTHSTWHEFAQLPTGILSLVMDENGLWIGTENGLYRAAAPDLPVIDGASTASTLAAERFEVIESIPSTEDDSEDFTQQDAQQNNPIFDLFLDEAGLYVGDSTGLHYYRDGEWANIELPPTSAFAEFSEPWCAGVESAQTNGSALSGASSDLSRPLSVYAIWVDPQQGLWIGTAYGAARRIPTPESSSQCWTLLPTYTPDGTPTLVQELTGDAEGAVWAVTDGGGALLFEEYGNVTLIFGRDVPGNLNTNFVRDVAIDQDGAVWFATPIGVFQYLDRTWYMEPGYTEATGVTIGEPNLHNVRDILIDRTGEVWIATAAGIRIKESSTVESTRHVAASSSLPSDNVYALAEDHEGGVWAGTDGAGVARFIDDAWQTPIPTASLPSVNVTNLVADANGAIWIGTDRGLAVYSLEDDELVTLDELAGYTIKSLAFDSTERLWIATSNQSESSEGNASIWRLTRDGDEFQLQEEPLQQVSQSSELPHAFELSLAADYRFPGGIWLAIDQVGLYYWDGSDWHNGDPDGELPTDFLWTIYTTPSSNDLWVGNEGGVSRFDGRTWGTLKDVDGLASSAIWAIAGSPVDGYWFGGRSGLSYYRPDSTPPWIRMQEISGDANRVDSNGFLSIDLGASIGLATVAGDLQTPQDKLELYYRRVPLLENGEADLTDVSWAPFDGTLSLTTDLLGNSRIELQARDLAFNYSEILAIPLSVVPVNQIDLSPIGLGKMERSTFFTVLVLGALALLGFGYVSLEMVQSRRRAIEAVVRSYNPYVSGEPIRRDDMFFGRHNLLQRIIDTLHNNSIMLHGERRIGKTTMLYQIATRLEDVDDPDYWFVPIYVDLEGTTQEMFFHFLVEEIVHKVARDYSWDDEHNNSGSNTANGDELRHNLGESGHPLDQLIFVTRTGESYTDREFNRDLRRIVRYLQSYGEEAYPDRKLRMILMMDEMDVMSSYDHLIQQQLRRIFMRDFASTMGAVVAGIEINKDWERIESPWYNMFNEIQVEPFTDEQGVELLVEPVKDYYSYDPDAVDFIIEHSEGRPFRIQQYGLEVVTNMLAAGRRRIKLEDVLVAHQNIQNSYTIAHSADGLSDDYPASGLRADNRSNGGMNNSELPLPPFLSKKSKESREMKEQIAL